VTVYGKISADYTYSKSSYKKFAGIESGKGIGGLGTDGGNYVGFRGEEALGNGLKAIFDIQWGFSADNTGLPANSRLSFVGLAGNFGKVTAGKDSAPSDRYLGGTAPNGISGYDAVVFLRDDFGNQNVLTGAKWADSISYVSPNLSGFEFTGSYSFGEKVNKSKSANGNGYDCVTANATTTCYKGADTSDAGKLGLGVKYTNGPLYLTAVYEAQADDDGQKPYAGASNKGYGAKGWAIGGSYDFKVVKLFANYYRQKANHNGEAYGENNVGSDKQSLWSIGGAIPVSSAGTVTLEYAQYKDYLGNNEGTRDAEVLNPGHKAKAYSIGYNHSLSKRTALHANLVRVNNDRGIGAGWSKTGVVGKDQTTFTTGIVHLF
jgi:predicted porin